MINLLSKEEKKKIRAEYRLRVFSVCLPIFAGVFSFAIISLLPAYFFAQISNDRIIKELKSAEAVSKITQVEEMRDIVLNANKKINLLEPSLQKNNAWDIFGEILKIRPSGITITNYEYHRNIATTKTKGDTTTIVLNGMSERREMIQAFAEELRENTNFVSVDLPISSLVSESNFAYSINIVVKEPA